MAGGNPAYNPHQDTRNGKGRYTRSPETAAQDARAAELRAQGRTYKQIAEELGFAGHKSASEAVRRAVRDACAGPGKALIDLEVTRLEAISDEVMDILQRDHVVVSHGKVITMKDPETGEEKPLLDDGVKLQAIDRYIRARESLRRLLGLDQPQKVQHSGGVTYEVVGVDPEDLT